MPASTTLIGKRPSTHIPAACLCANAYAKYICTEIWIKLWSQTKRLLTQGGSYTDQRRCHWLPSCNLSSLSPYSPPYSHPPYICLSSLLWSQKRWPILGVPWEILFIYLQREGAHKRPSLVPFPAHEGYPFPTTFEKTFLETRSTLEKNRIHLLRTTWAMKRANKKAVGLVCFKLSLPYTAFSKTTPPHVPQSRSHIP